MRFIGRALIGLVLACLTVGLIGIGAWRINSARVDAGSRPPRQVQERIFNVDIATLKARSVTPVIRAFGQVQAWRMLEIRAAESGAVTKISPNFRDGAIVAKDELLFQIDPAEYKRRLDDAKVALALATTEWTEAKDTLPIAAAEVEFAKRQVAIRKNELDRKLRLKGRGFAAAASIDVARHAVNVAEQALIVKQRAVLAARVAIERKKFAEERARIAVKDANKSFIDTKFKAPFSGPITGVVANLGKRLSKNEKLGVLIDPASLEVSFRVSEEEYGRLLADGKAGRLKKLNVTARLDLGVRQVSLKGMLDRAASVTNLTAGGRKIFARIKADAALQIRPGDFVTVSVFETPLTNVASIPAVAATDDGEILLLTSDDRVETHRAKILRRQSDNIIVTNVPFGREFIAARQPFLAAGVKVRPQRKGAKPKPTHVALSKEKREALKKFVKSRRRMPKFVQDRLLKALEKPRVRIAMVKRLESGLRRMGSRGRPSGQTIALSQERRAALQRYVKNHQRMPDPVKQRILARLKNANVPATMVRRLEQNMGGNRAPGSQPKAGRP